MKISLLKTVLFLTILLGLSCSNNDDPQEQLPPITQNGANTFGCIINGEVLIPKDGIGIPQPRGLTIARRPNKNFIIDAANLKDTSGDRIYIYIYNLTSTGTYSFGLSNGEEDLTFKPDFPYCWVRTFDTTTGGIRYFSNTDSGTITITKLDTVNKIVSGTFRLTVFNKDNPHETIEISDGRFDINWSTI